MCKPQQHMAEHPEVAPAAALPVGLSTSARVRILQSGLRMLIVQAPFQHPDRVCFVHQSVSSRSGQVPKP